MLKTAAAEEAQTDAGSVVVWLSTAVLTYPWDSKGRPP
jgi:hypothetical protein